MRWCLRLFVLIGILFVFHLSALGVSAQYLDCSTVFGGECRGTCLTSQVIVGAGHCTNNLYNCCVAPTPTPTISQNCSGTCKGTCLTSEYQITGVCSNASYKCCSTIPPTAGPSPTPRMNTCTGGTSCTTLSTACNCNTSTGTNHGSTTSTTCVVGGTSTTCFTGCADDTSCYSIPPAGCPNPANAANGCSWVPANDCIGGSCGVGERRIASQYCGAQHCNDQCAADAACGAVTSTNTPGTGGPGSTNTPIPPPPGSTNTPVPPGSTNTPIPPTNTPTNVPVGTIKVRAVQVDPADTSCTAIRAVPTTDPQIDGSSFIFTPGSASHPASVPPVQSLADYVTFANATAGSYTVDPTVPDATWAYIRSCWFNETNGTSGESQSTILAANQTIRWDIGFTSGTAWVQTEGSEVYASGSIRSFVPAVTGPPYFNLDGTTGGYPGIVQYGSSYDFDSDALKTGNATGDRLMSSSNWEVKGARTTVNFYDLLYRRFGSPTTADTFADQNAVIQAEFQPRDTPYYVVGDMKTSGNLTTSGNVVFLVNGNLTIDGNITATGDGFVAFIVNGNITVTSNVGRNPDGASADAPNIEGIYIASNAAHSGTFATGTSAALATARFVGQGAFVADNFQLQRDLDGLGVGGNTDSSAELFIYNPKLLILMPDQMKDLAVTWQEVAP